MINYNQPHTRFIDEALGLLLHPFLIVVLHILFVFSTTTVGFPHRRLEGSTNKMSGLDGYIHIVDKEFYIENQPNLTESCVR